MTVLDWPDWGVPQANATAISTTGAPLLRLTNPQGTAASATLAGGGLVTLLNAIPVNQPGYELTFDLYLPAAAGTVPFALLTLTWSDAVSGIVTDIEEFILTAGNGPGNFLEHYLTGPCRGSALSVSLINSDPATVLTYSWAVNLTSHPYLHDRLIQQQYQTTAPVGFTNPAGNPTTGLLASVTATIAIGATTSRLLAAWNGKAKVSLDNLGTGGGLIVRLQDPGSLYSSNTSARFFAFQAAAGAFAQGEVNFPNGPVLMQLTNQSSTVTITPNVAVVKVEY